MNRAWKALTAFAALVLALLALAPGASAQASKNYGKYTIVAWAMPSWVNSTTPTWDQTFVGKTTAAHKSLAVETPYTCGTQYQVDAYLTSKLPASGVPTTLHEGDDYGWFDGKSPSGWGHDYQLIYRAPCTEVTPIAPTVTAGVCNPKTGVDSPPVVTTDTTTEGLQYDVDGLTVEARFLEPDKYVWVNPLPAGWTLIDLHDGLEPFARYVLTVDQPPCAKDTPTPTPTTSSPSPTPTHSTSSPTPTTSTHHNVTTPPASTTPAKHHVVKHQSPSTSPAAHQAALANTGSHTGLLLGIGLGALCGGVALLVLGSKRREH